MLFILLIFVMVQHGFAKDKCESIRVPMCKSSAFNGERFYNMTTANPNFLGHRNQEEAGLEINQFFPLLKVNCSSYLRMFLCSLYVPICSASIIRPCRELCVKSRSGCEPLMKKFGFRWPEVMECSKFATSENNVCFNGPLEKTRKTNCTACVDNSPSSLKKNCRDSDLAFVGKFLNIRNGRRVKFEILKQLKTPSNLGRKIRKMLRKKRIGAKLEIPKDLCRNDCGKFEGKKKYIVFLKLKSGEKPSYVQAGAIPYQAENNIC